MQPVHKSAKLANVCYDIRGPVLEKARQMEEEGQHIIKLNIGNIAAFGLEPPDEIVQDMIRNLPNAAGYTDSQGPVRAAQGDRPLHAAKARQGRDGRRRLPRQRRLRADHDEHERAAQRRRRGADPRARLSALDRRRSRCRAERRCTTSATKPPTGCPTSTTWRRKITRAHARDRRHQPEQPDRRALSDRAAARRSSRSRASTS